MYQYKSNKLFKKNTKELTPEETIHRIRALEYLYTGKPCTQKDIAQMLNIGTTSVHQWLTTWNSRSLKKMNSLDNLKKKLKSEYARALVDQLLEKQVRLQTTRCPTYKDCPYCKGKVRNKASFCEHCGRALKRHTDPTDSPI